MEDRLTVAHKPRVPDFLKPSDRIRYSLSDRPPLEIDNLDGDGTALNTVRKRPGHKTKIFKQTSRRLAEAEEWLEFVRKKKESMGDT